MDPPSARDVLEAAAREAPESEARWRLVSELHRRDDQATFSAAETMLSSPAVERRILAVDVLAQMGAEAGVAVEDRRFRNPAITVLLPLLSPETDPAVLESVAIAFSHLSDERAVPALHDLRRHSDPKVRRGATFGLLGLDVDLAIEALIELTTDSDLDVRDWATFGLGIQLDRDTPAIRAALVGRLDDTEADTRAEALRGLARRGEPRMIPALLAAFDDAHELSDPDILEAALFGIASRTGDERLKPLIDQRLRAQRQDFPADPMPARLAAAAARFRR